MLTHFLRQHTLKNHLLVFIQLIGIAISCYPIGLQNHGNFNWLILCAAGASLGVWTLCFNKISNFSVYPEIKAHAKLITNGPYRFIRHPMYTALMMMMIGIACVNFHMLNFIGAFLTTVAVINKANEEEKLLLIRFAEYYTYQKNTERFIPHLY